MLRTSFLYMEFVGFGVLLQWPFLTSSKACYTKEK